MAQKSNEFQVSPNEREKSETISRDAEFDFYSAKSVCFEALTNQVV